MNSVVIAASARTPFGVLQGAFSNLKASELGAIAIKAAVKAAGIESSSVETLFMGCVLPAGMGQAPARQAAIYAGLGDGVPTVTLNKMCGSGLEALIQAYRMVALGEAEIVVAGGMESMTNAPYVLPKARAGYRMGNGEIIDSMVNDGLWDAYNNKHMGSCAEICATQYNFSREDQDTFAIRSYERPKPLGNEAFC
ncbi:MAG: beta-ketoacyl synthase N-terminal-like domain-containing protein [Deinococcales bacterium]